MPLLTRLFPLWAVLISALAILSPATFRPLGPWITPLLALVMFAMGLTLRLADRDALCWAGAVERVAGMGTSYGLSLCLRLLALVDLLAHARWASGLFSLRRGQAELSAALLGAAATAPLTAEARFDEQRLRATLAPAGSPA